jgi:glycosyltransferase involved in cell wall biosynthesis
MDKPEISIIIPAYNEAQNIGKVISDIKALHPNFEIIVVNDGSSDDTVSVASAAEAVVYSHPYNIGNGAAIKSGIRIASGEVLVFMDADGQHSPEELNSLLEHIPAYDMVVGARQRRGQASWGRAMANHVYNGLASYVTKFYVQDLTSGFRVIKSDIARHLLYLLPNTYSYPATLTLGVLRTGRSVKYVPIKGQPRKGGKSKVRIVRDGVRFFMIITKICGLYSPLRIFLPTSCAVFFTGLGYYLYTFLTAGRFTNMSALLFTTSILIFMLGLVSEQISQMRFERSEGDRFI